MQGMKEFKYESKHILPHSILNTKGNGSKGLQEVHETIYNEVSSCQEDEFDNLN